MSEKENAFRRFNGDNKQLKIQQLFAWILEVANQYISESMSDPITTITLTNDIDDAG